MPCVPGKLYEVNAGGPYTFYRSVRRNISWSKQVDGFNQTPQNSTQIDKADGLLLFLEAFEIPISESEGSYNFWVHRFIAPDGTSADLVSPNEAREYVKEVT